MSPKVIIAGIILFIVIALIFSYSRKSSTVVPVNTGIVPPATTQTVQTPPTISNQTLTLPSDPYINDPITSVIPINLPIVNVQPQPVSTTPTITPTSVNSPVTTTTTIPTVTTTVPQVTTTVPPVTTTIPTISTPLPTTTTVPTVSTPLPAPVTVPKVSTPLPAPPAPLSYVGCYKDTNSRAMPTYLGTLTASDCFNKARAAGAKFVGLQWPEGYKNNITQCYYSTSTTAPYNKYGSATVCNMSNTSGQKLGGYFANSVYKLF